MLLSNVGDVRVIDSTPDIYLHEDIRGYLVHLAQQRRVAPSTYNQTRCALKFFYQVTIGVPVNSIRESASPTPALAAAAA